jgi:hypothetical protein
VGAVLAGIFLAAVVAAIAIIGMYNDWQMSSSID